MVSNDKISLSVVYLYICTHNIFPVVSGICTDPAYGYLNCRIQIPIRTASQVVTFYYVELFTLHRVIFRFQS